MSTPKKSFLRDSLEALLVAFLFAVFARTWVVQAFKIPTGSMEQNLLVGDHVLVNKFIYGPTLSPLEEILLPLRPVRRGDVVVFKSPEHPERDFIKRCLALSGDDVEIVDKVLHLGGEAVEEDAYTYHDDPVTYPESPFVPEHYRARDQFGPFEVPAGHVFCLGDNRDRSDDSRFWGPVPRKLVKGRGLLVYWSVATGGDDRTARPRPGPWWHRPAEGLREMRESTRWERIFTVVR